MLCEVLMWRYAASTCVAIELHWWLIEDAAAYGIPMSSVISVMSSKVLPRNAVCRSLRVPLAKRGACHGFSNGIAPALNWKPTNVEFVDQATGKIETFRVHGMRYIRPGKLKLPID
jgi:hypothetical protein